MKEITILLTGFPLGYEETIDALINMDQDIELNEDMLNRLIKICPNTDENQAISDFITKQGTVDQITNPIEALIFSISQVPEISLRLKCLQMRSSFDF
jgi:hypothetical protein